MRTAAARIGAAALLGAAAMLASAAAAQTQDDSPAARIAAANAMFDACGERKQIEVYFEMSAQMVVREGRIHTPTLSDAQWQAYQQIVAADLKKDIDGYVAYTTATYAEHFTVDDIKAMEAFCRSPVGQKISGMRGQMEADTFEYRQLWMRTALIAAMSDAQQKVQAGGNAL